MASTYSPNLAITLLGTGDGAGTWGDTTNTNLGTIIEEAISGYVTQAVATGTDTTITIPNNTSGVARNMYLELTGTGGASTNLIVPANKKLYFIFNNTSSGQVTVKVSGQTGVSVPNGKKMILVSNGTDIVTAENYVASLSSDNLSLTGSLSVGTTSAFTGVATFTANPVLNGGTANGVLYLNGSKVATSGSALTFDGANLGLGVTPSAWASSKAIQFGLYSSLFGLTSASRTVVGQNVYFDGSFRYIASAVSAGWYQQSGNEHSWSISTDVSPTAGNPVTSSTAMVLTSAGNLGIGTTGSSTVRTSIRGSTADTSANAVLIENSSASQLFRVRNDGFIEAGIGGPLAVTSSGNVGIGTASPAYKLDVRGGVITAGNGTIFGGISYSTRPEIGAISNHPVGFITNNTTQMLLDTSGNLGIGTTSPGRKLDVVAANNTAIRALSGASGSYVSYGVGRTAEEAYISVAATANNFITGSAAGDLTINNNAGNVLITAGGSATQLYLNTSGNLGLGVTPSAWSGIGKTLQINTGGSFSADSANAYFAANCYYNGTNWIYQTTNNATRYTMASNSHQWYIAPSGTAGNAITGANAFVQSMTLDSSGNLGIGTASPGSKLDVRGANSNNLSDLGAQIVNAVDTTAYAQNNGGGIGFGYVFNSGGSVIGRAAVIKAVKENATDGNYATSLVFANAANSLNTIEKMRLDSAGNLGLGVTPTSAWDSGFKVIQLGGGAYFGQYNNNAVQVGLNTYFNGTNYIYTTTNEASRFAQTDGQFQWFTAPSGTAGNPITFTQSMTLDASGNLGVGTTSPGVRLDVLASSSPNPIRLTSGAGTSIRFDTTRSFTVNRNWLVGCDYISEGLFSIIPSTTLGGGAFTTPALSVSSAGEVLIATTSVTQGVSTAETSVVARGKDTTNTSASFVTVSYNGSGVGYLGTSGSTNETFLYAKSNHALILGTNNTERGRFTADGNFYVNTTGAGGKVYVVSDLTSNNGLRVDVPASFTSNAIALVSATAAGTGWYFLTGESSGGSTRIQIRGDGNVYNANGTYGTVSDARLKQDIVDAGSQWDDLKAIRFRKYRMKSDVEADPNAPALFGVVAQELEQVCPGLVDDGEIKTVKSSILLMKAAKALQEAMARIESLEADMAALKEAQ